MSDGDEEARAKLARGRPGGRPAAAWWHEHGRAMGDYLVVASRRRGGPLESAVRDRLMGGAALWESSVSASGRPACRGLMAGHVALERELADAFVAADRRRLVELAGLVGDNARNQALALGSCVRGFPEGRFSELLSAHSALFAEAAGALLSGDRAAYARSEAARAANTAALAALSSEWL